MKAPKLMVLPWLVLLLALPQPLWAQNPVTNTNITRQPLWKIQGKRAAVYLLGSIHILKKEHYPLATPIQEAFGRAKIAVFETDIAAAEKPELQAKLLSLASLPAGETLKEHVSPKLYEQVCDYLKADGLSAEAMAAYKPGLVALTIVYLEARRLGFDEMFGVDRHFYERAQTDGKEIVHLETPENQMKLFTEHSRRETELFLECMLKDVHTLKEKIGPCVRFWQAGNMEELAKLVNEGLGEYPALYRRIVLDRNRQWVPTIEKLVRGDKDAIVIVGAGHLAGKQNLIELLENKTGFKAIQQ